MVVAIKLLTKCGQCGNRGSLETYLEVLNKPLTSCGIRCYICENYLGSLYLLKDAQEVIRHPVDDNLIGISYTFI